MHQAWLNANIAEANVQTYTLIQNCSCSCCCGTAMKKGRANDVARPSEKQTTKILLLGESQFGAFEVNHQLVAAKVVGVPVVQAVLG